MSSPTNEELGLDANGFPPTDESGDVDLNQIEWNLKLTPEERLARLESFTAFMDLAKAARNRNHGSLSRNPRTPAEE
jgi:hypothetical protein